MSLGTRRTPERNSALLGGIPVVKGPVAAITVGSGTTPMTLTAAQVAVGLLPFNCTDTSTVNLPTADLLAAGFAGPMQIGDWFELSMVNYGDSTITVGMGTGITNKVIDSEDAILDIATHIGVKYALVRTGVANPSDPSTSNTFDFYLLATSTCTSS